MPDVEAKTSLQSSVVNVSLITNKVNPKKSESKFHFKFLFGTFLMFTCFDHVSGNLTISTNWLNEDR